MKTVSVAAVFAAFVVNTETWCRVVPHRGLRARNNLVSLSEDGKELFIGGERAAWILAPGFTVHFFSRVLGRRRYAIQSRHPQAYHLYLGWNLRDYSRRFVIRRVKNNLRTSNYGLSEARVNLEIARRMQLRSVVSHVQATIRRLDPLMFRSTNSRPLPLP